MTPRLIPPGSIRSRPTVNLLLASVTWFSLAANIFSPPVQAQTGYNYSGEIRFDIKQVPFSRYGSYLAISDLSSFQPPSRKSGVFLRTLHEGGKPAFRLQLVHDGAPTPFTTEATPTRLTLSSPLGSVEISFQGPDRLRLRGHGVGIRLDAEDAWAVRYPDDHWEVSSSPMKYMLWPLNGKVLETHAGEDNHPAMTFEPNSGQDTFETELDAYTSAWHSHDVEGSFDETQQKERAVYSAWLRTMPAVAPGLEQGAELAAYVNWESVVEPSGNLKRPAMLMSKNWMSSVWSWDHTFNSMATSLSQPQFAWDQFMLPIDVQDVNGAFPDKWDADTIAWQFSKPPVHGWALAWLRRHGSFQDRKHLAEVYEPLERWTEWYFRYRDTNGNGLPEYRHGNESGWDNSTAMTPTATTDAGLIESPDLSAYLVLQMETLSNIARTLGRREEARHWKQRSDQLLQRMLKRFWNGHEFVAFHLADGREIRSESLLLSMPIILGHRLPPQIQREMIKNLRRTADESPFGLPSEPPDSQYYVADGYWRGPIWAPSTMIVTEGLDDLGENALASSLRRKFCLMAQKSGMAENFDAKTGAALRDPAYTWTASVYLLFAHQLAAESHLP